MFDEIINKYHIIQITEDKVGRSKDGVYQLKSLTDSYYLKVSSSQEIINEEKAYRYLEGKLNVPKVYEFKQDENGKYYLLISEMKGKMLYELLQYDIRETIILYARALKTIHALPYRDYPIKKNIREIIRDIKYRLDDIRVEDLSECYQSLGVQKTYERLVSLMPEYRDLVICHGDYSMPNILVGETVGFIDLGSSGVDDRYQDIAIALRSLKYNLELIGETYLPEHQQLFLDAYGIQTFNQEKYEFYFLLEEFF